MEMNQLLAHQEFSTRLYLSDLEHGDESITSASGILDAQIGEKEDMQRYSDIPIHLKIQMTR